MITEAKQIIGKLNEINSELDYITEHIGDSILTEDDLKSLNEARNELKKGKTISHEDLKKELGI